MKKLLLIAALVALTSPSFAQIQRLNPSAMQVTPTGLTINSLATWLRNLYDMITLNGVDTVAGTSYALATSDTGRTKIFTNAGDVAVSIVAATTTGFTAGYNVRVENASTAGIVTVTPETSTIKGATTWKLAPGQSGTITSDGTNYSVTNDTTLGNVWYPYADTTFGGSTAVGIGALSSLAGATATAYANTAVGYHALGEGTLTTAALGNTAVGTTSLKNVTTGSFNTSVGGSSGRGITSGVRNTVVGYLAGISISTQSDNVIIGEEAFSAGASSKNVAIGQASIYRATGIGNTAVGYEAGGSFNSGITTGAFNTVVGYQVAKGATLTTGSSNILIGTSSLVTTPANSTSNYISIGNAIIGTAAAPTIASGFGSGASVTAGVGTGAFRVNVGTGGTAQSGVVGLGSAPAGWNCYASDITTPASFNTKMISSTATSATFQNYSMTTGLAIAWTASDVLAISCFGY